MNRVVQCLLFVLAAAGWFLAQTVLADAVPDAAVVALAAVGALALAAVAAPPTRTVRASLSRGAILSSALAGALMTFLAPLLVMSNRLTDAPPGSEVLFFTTAAWGLTAVLVAYALPQTRPTGAQLAFALVGLLGVATLVANWERPSSFSPLVRYPAQEVGFLLAGLAWAVGSMLLVRVSSEGRDRAPLFVAAVTGAAVSVVWAALDAGPAAVRAVGQEPVASFVAATAFGVMYLMWARLIAVPRGLAASSSLWFLPALAVTALGLAEQALAPHGPDPVVWTGALGGALLAALAVAGSVLAARRSADPAPVTARSPVVIASALLSAAAVLLAVVALALPAFSATVAGTLTNGEAYRVTWSLAGYESAGGWAAALAGGLLVVAVWAFAYGPRRVAWSCLAAASLTALSYLAVAATPLHTWNRWVPVELQSEYGTEYVSLTFTTIHDPVRVASLVTAAVAALVIAGALVSGSRRRSRDRSEVIS